MPMSDEDYAAVNAHINRLPEGLVCPFCRGTREEATARGWNIEGLAREGVLDRQEMYVVVLSCCGCQFLCHLKWDPIVAATRTG